MFDGLCKNYIRNILNQQIVTIKNATDKDNSAKNNYKQDLHK